MTVAESKLRRSIADGPASCRACGTHVNLTVDHIKPKSQGGDGKRRNLQILCEPSHREKDRTVPAGEPYSRLRRRVQPQPRQAPGWAKDLVWSEIRQAYLQP